MCIVYCMMYIANPHLTPQLSDYSPLQNTSVDHHNLYNGYNPYRHMVG